MSMDIKGLHFKVADFISNGTAKTKLAIFRDKGCENNPVLISEHFDRPKQSSGFQMTFVSHGYGKLRNPDYLD